MVGMLGLSAPLAESCISREGMLGYVTQFGNQKAPSYLKRSWGCETREPAVSEPVSPGTVRIVTDCLHTPFRTTCRAPACGIFSRMATLRASRSLSTLNGGPGMKKENVTLMPCTKLSATCQAITSTSFGVGSCAVRQKGIVRVEKVADKQSGRQP